MSVTLINPAAYSSIQDDLWTIASSTASGQTDFKFVFDVYSGTDQLVRCKVYPDPSNGKGYFNAGSVVRNEVDYSWFIPVNGTSNFLYTANNKVKQTYDIRVGEDYSGITTLNLASGSITAYNYAPALFKRGQTKINSFLNKWLTNRPLSAKCDFESKLLIPFYTNSVQASGTSTLQVSINGGSFSTASTANQTFATSQGEEFYQLNIGPKAINTAKGSTVITENTEYYDVRIITSVGGSFSNFRVYLDCNPTYTPYNLYFINQYGMFDTACFNLVSKLSLDVERKSYTKVNKKFGTSSVAFYDSNNVYYQSKINHSNKINWTYKLTMDFMTDAEYVWLSELLMSRTIYIDIENNYYPVTIKNTNYEYIKHNVQGLRVLELDIELNQERYGFQK